MATYRLDFDEDGDPIFKEESELAEDETDAALAQTDPSIDWQSELRRELRNAGLAA